MNHNKGEKMLNRKIFDCDIIIVGGGIIGLASAHEAAKRGKKVIVLEQYPLFHQRGSSIDHVRMWRVMYTELHHAKLAIAAGDLWTELEQKLGTELMQRNGLLNFGVETPLTPEGTIETAVKVMD